MNLILVLSEVAGVGGPCPATHYCPAGTSSPFPCKADTYNNITQQAECFTCPAGYYCPDNTTNFEDYPCPVGYYCPDGTNHSTEYPCPEGTYRADLGGMDVNDCTPCPCGKHCSNIGLTAPVGDCDAGACFLVRETLLYPVNEKIISIDM